MKEDKVWRISLVLIAALFTFGVIGWAKYVDEKKEVETWQSSYIESQKNLRNAEDKLLICEYNHDEVDKKLMNCVFSKEFHKNRSVENFDERIAACEHDMKFYKRIVDESSCYHSDGLSQLAIDMLRKELYACQGGSWNDARILCLQNKNCSACMEMTDDNLAHCFTYAYYPR